MKLFQCKVRLSGSMLNEVVKTNVTAAEIILLRELHGNDAIHDVEHIANVNRTDGKERARLSGIYSKSDPKGHQSGEELVRMFLGVGAQALPDEPPAVAEAASEEKLEAFDASEEEITLVDEAPIRRRKVARVVADAPADALTA